MVPGLLYLDTARLGRMCAKARRVVRDFAGLAGEVGLPLYGEEFLRFGFATLPAPLQRQFPSLACWSGISSLKHSLRQIAGGPSHLPVFVANRSTQLMRAAADILFARCRRVLTTDIDWPGYRTLLDHERSRHERRLCEVPVRNAVFRHGATVDEIVERVVSEYRRHNCDGLYLTAVSHDGIRFPVETIVRHIERYQALNMVVVDGAQDFCHTGSPLDTGCFDIYIAGCHKWLRAYQPMGVAFVGGRSRSDASMVVEIMGRGEIDDPLFRFTRQIEQECLDSHTETVNVTPLFSCAGAVDDAMASWHHREDQRRQQLVNAELVAELAQSAGWSPLLPDVPFRTGILLLQNRRESATHLTPHQMRTEFQEHGIGLTAYENGQIRLSMPKWPLAGCDIDRLRKSLQRAA